MPIIFYVIAGYSDGLPFSRNFANLKDFIFSSGGLRDCQQEIDAIVEQGGPSIGSPDTFCFNIYYLHLECDNSNVYLMDDKGFFVMTDEEYLQLQRAYGDTRSDEELLQNRSTDPRLTLRELVEISDFFPVGYRRPVDAAFNDLLRDIDIILGRAPYSTGRDFTARYPKHGW